MTDHRGEVRVAVATSDHGRLLAALQSGWPQCMLQWVGDGLAAAVAGGRGDAEPPALRCAEALRERKWDGDRELAASIEAALGAGPTPALKPLPVDLEDLGMILEGDPLNSGGCIDLRDGEVWPQVVLDDGAVVDLDELDPDQVLWVHSEGSRPGYADMEEFIALIEDGLLADRLERAIQGSGAFRRFKDVLRSDPVLLQRWYGFSEERQRGRARSWLAAEGYAPVPRAGGSNSSWC